MEESKFFRLVWRFNSIVIFCAGLLAIGVLIFASYQIYKDLSRDRITHNIVNIDENNETQEEWRYGQLTEISGSNYFMLPLYSDQSFDGSKFSKSSSSTRNYLFIDAESSQRKWLFDHTDYLIQFSDSLQVATHDSQEPTIAIFYVLVKHDSDQNNRLSADDLSTIAFTRADGSNYKELIKDVELLVDHTLLSKTELLLIYQKGGVSYSSIINLESFEITNNEKLPIVGSQ